MLRSSCGSPRSQDRGAQSPLPRTGPKGPSSEKGRYFVDRATNEVELVQRIQRVLNVEPAMHRGEGPTANHPRLCQVCEGVQARPGCRVGSYGFPALLPGWRSDTDDERDYPGVCSGAGRCVLTLEGEAHGWDGGGAGARAPLAAPAASSSAKACTLAGTATASTPAISSPAAHESRPRGAPGRGGGLAAPAAGRAKGGKRAEAACGAPPRAGAAIRRGLLVGDDGSIRLTGDYQAVVLVLNRDQPLSSQMDQGLVHQVGLIEKRNDLLARPCHASQVAVMCRKEFSPSGPC
eukprot:2316662-Rhodomonas_salina.2